jgi:isoaspartyl peptidase/L-asparaginase-like protein (Ntn-hydrolase superfamily)
VRDHFGDDTGGADPSVGASESRQPNDHDTVGAVAGDGERFAAATSTGGRWFAISGRVGDVPQTGSGFFCSPAGGASATGAGEDIARTTLARRAVDRLETGDDAQTAAERALDRFEAETGSTAGLIVLSGEGVGSAFNSEAMQTAVVE